MPETELSRKEARFKLGDLAILDKPFRFQGDDEEWDTDTDRKLHTYINDGSGQVICKIIEVNPHTLREYEHYQVMFENTDHRTLYVDGSCLQPLGPTPEEIQAAIQSILDA